MTEIAFIEHRLSNRVRLRVPAMRGDAAYFERLADALADLEPVQQVVANPRTGSILVQLDGSPEAVIEAGRTRELFQIGTSGPTSQQAAPRAPRGAQPFHRLGVAGAGLLGLSLLQAGRGEMLSSATESFWHARAADERLNRPFLAAIMLLAGIYQVMNGRVLGSASSLLIYALTIQIGAHRSG
jgi:hypothetical protein